MLEVSKSEKSDKKLWFFKKNRLADDNKIVKNRFFWLPLKQKDVKVFLSIAG